MDNTFDSNNNKLIPQYDVLKQNYSSEEKVILSELRENLVDIAISDETFQVNEDKLLNNIKNFLFERFSTSNINNKVSNEYLDNLSHRLLSD